MDVPLLRTLTYKSVLGFGSYGDMTIQQILDLKHTRYLRNIYFTCSKINFTPEILDQIFVPLSYRINKPGIDKEKLKKLNASIYAHRSEKYNDNYKTMAHVYKNMRGFYKSVNISENRKFSKGNLQARNHGH